MDWYPEPGETLLIRTPVAFASGMAAPVAGLRSFRDPARRDIQGELAGWPPRPPFQPRSGGDQAVGNAVGGIFKAVPAVLNLLSALGGPLSTPFGDRGAKGETREPENEVEDFPVIWAERGTLARTLPWQLDPARCPKGLRTDLVVTDQRLVVLGIGSADLGARADVLWEAPRASVAAVERMEFSEIKADVRIRFTDGSWTRLFASSAGNAAKVVQHLSGAARFLTEAELSEGQRARVARFMAELPSEAQAPALTALPSGVVLVESKVPLKRMPGKFETNAIYMGADGEPAAPKPGDLT